jgi:hypothetical protein
MVKDNEMCGKQSALTPANQSDQDSLPRELAARLIDSREGNSINAFFVYYFFGLPPKECAALAGYTPSYGYKLIHKYRHIPKFRHTVDEFLKTMPDRYQSICKARLIEVCDIEGAALKEYRHNPKLAIDKPQLLKHIKQGAGAMDRDEFEGKTLTVNIQEIRNFLVERDDDRLPDKHTIDVKVIDTKGEAE